MVLCFCSGFAALIYEIVWLQQFSLFLGATSVSVAIVLATFMAGLSAGSLAANRLWLVRQNGLRGFGLLELGVGLWGLLSLALFPIAEKLYCHFTIPGSGDLFVRCLIATGLMFPASFLMGASLPILAQVWAALPDGILRVGRSYAANTVGAAIGSLVAGFYLLPLHDISFAIGFAAGVNICAAFAALFSHRWIESQIRFVNSFEVNHAQPALTTGFATARDLTPTTRRIVETATFLSGLTAIGAETIWTRQLTLVLGPTVYSFSILLALFLIGLSLGNAIGVWLSRRVRSPIRTFSIVQALLMIAIPCSANLIVDFVPHFLVLHGSDERLTVRITRDLIRSGAAILPPALLWGISSTVAMTCLSSRQRPISELTGRLLGANTLGAIAGALGIGIVAMPFGSQLIHRLLMLISAANSGLLFFAFLKEPPHEATNQSRTVLRAFQPALTIVLGMLAWPFLSAPPDGLLAEGRWTDRTPDSTCYLFVAEGRDFPVVVSQQHDGTRCFHVAGKIEASTRERDIRTQRLLGHLPALANPHPRSVLVIGCGSGMTAGSLLAHPSVERIVICEIEPRVIDAARATFSDHNRQVLDDPKTSIVTDDARRYLATTHERFDVITVDPIHPWVKGSAALYTAEFYESCKKHLNPGGNMALWVPLYESNAATVQCELATFIEQFPASTLWSGQSQFIGYDVVLVGTFGQPSPISNDMILRATECGEVAESLSEIGIGEPDKLAELLIGYGNDLSEWLHDVPLNHDWNLRLQYLAGASSDGATEQIILDRLRFARDTSRERHSLTAASDPILLE